MANIEYMYVTGRFIQGDIFTPNTKNMTGGPLVTKDGRPRQEFWIRVAVPKNDAAMAQEYAKLQAIAAAGFPGGESARPDFSWKVVDGDDPKFVGREAYKGCLLFKATTGFDNVAKVSRMGGKTVHLTDQDIKKGDYVRIAFTAQPNGDRQKPGLYLNLSLIELIGYGEEIIGGPDPDSILSAVGAAALPAGASATPVGPAAPMGVPAQTAAPMGVPAQTAAPMGVPAQPAAPVPPPTGITPAPDFLNPPVLTAKAGGASYQQFIDQGWTDETLRQHGYLA
jgi:hypothetical protein